MKRCLNIFLSLLILVSLLSLPALAINRGLESADGLDIGDRIPGFELEGSDGKWVPYSKYRGKVLLLIVTNYCSKDLAGSWAIQSYYRYSRSSDFEFPLIFSRRCIPFFVPDWFVRQSANDTAVQVQVPPFLMDWDEEYYEKFRGDLKKAHIYVVDHRGIIRWKMILTNPFVSSEPMNKMIEKLLIEKDERKYKEQILNNP